MLFAINYSPPAAALVTEKRIQVDRFKCPDWPDMIAEASQLRPVAVHFTLAAGRNKLHRVDWRLVERLLKQTDTPYVNLHLEPHVSDYPNLDLNDPGQVEILIEQIIDEIRLVTDRFTPQRVILENVPWRGAGYKVLRQAVQPDIITRLVEATGCGLLLDISHARIAAHHLGMDERAYMAQLPVHRLSELHFTGLHNLEGYLQDHLEALDTDWPVLDWVLDQIRNAVPTIAGTWKRPWMLSFEYGGVGEKFDWRSDPHVIAAQVPMLYERVTDL
jgi:uncharacterized protein (UPF0276 family)